MSQLCDPATLQIVHYPHPTLRHKSKVVRRVDSLLRDLVQRMIELMFEAKGVGLAANQVDLPLRLFVANEKSNPQEAETLVFINPVLSRPKGSEEAEEGCLSLPELYGNVIRPKKIHVHAFGLDGTEIDRELDGFLSRIVQHENDHLDGVVFPDRMSVTGRLDIADDLDDFETELTSRRQLGENPNDEEIAARLREWEQRYC